MGWKFAVVVPLSRELYLWIQRPISFVEFHGLGTLFHYGESL